MNVIVDELYSRQLFDDRKYTYLASLDIVPKENIVTIIGPSKTESLSGFRLGRPTVRKKLLIEWSSFRRLSH